MHIIHQQQRMIEERDRRVANEIAKRMAMQHKYGEPVVGCNCHQCIATGASVNDNANNASQGSQAQAGSSGPANGGFTTPAMVQGPSYEQLAAELAQPKRIIHTQQRIVEPKDRQLANNGKQAGNSQESISKEHAQRQQDRNLMSLSHLTAVDGGRAEAPSTSNDIGHGLSQNRLDTVPHLQQHIVPQTMPAGIAFSNAHLGTSVPLQAAAMMPPPPPRQSAAARPNKFPLELPPSNTGFDSQRFAQAASRSSVLPRFNNHGASLVDGGTQWSNPSATPTPSVKARKGDSVDDVIEVEDD